MVGAQVEDSGHGHDIRAQKSRQTFQNIRGSREPDYQRQIAMTASAEEVL